MDLIDYGQSFLAGKWTDNQVRFWIESRTRIIDDRSGVSEDYYQCASCKAEDTFAARDLFQKDNYDFLPIFGPEHGVIFRRKAWLNPNYKTVVKAADMWAGQVYHLIQPPQARLLSRTADILDATSRWLPLVARTEIADAATGLRAIMEYPVKTMNIQHAKGLYQVDTGPLAFPDLSRRCENHAQALALAFVAFNAPGFADFVVEDATALPQAGQGQGQVWHCSRILSLPASNTLYALEG